MNDAKDAKDAQKKRNRKKLKSTGSKSIEEEEEDLAQICLTGEEYVLEEKQELDLFLETEQESQTGTQSDDVITPSNTIDVTETGSNDDPSDVITPNVANQSEIITTFLDPTSHPAENTSLISGEPLDQSKKIPATESDAS